MLTKYRYRLFVNNTLVAEGGSRNQQRTEDEGVRQYQAHKHKGYALLVCSRKEFLGDWSEFMSMENRAVLGEAGE